jgi:N-acyl-D-amino-acid deacylase
VVFDEKEITDRSTFEAPHQFSDGFLLVMVNGQVILENKRHTGLKSGMPLYGPSSIKK